ncbi:uncharacterized protein N7500_000454 [Penicillium coprophilum]|uniref:uncharacterized protein n=1 Tax=Penicillium coprophilum TaxID=36646 RepID=UPI0023A57324|nr:uncharacterized protein N7500_000454 [Penicillium coprophilum]KAJ5177755.1 hypothetical protein N7500_000454 [Penicillium coprophilum]
MGLTKSETFEWHHAGSSTALESGKTTVEEAKADIDELYKTGKPFFPREKIQDLEKQMNALADKGGKLTVEDLNGDILECVVPKAEGELEGFKLRLDYRDAATLKYEIDIGWSSRKGLKAEAFCPLQLIYAIYYVEDDPTRKPETVAREFEANTQVWEASEACENFKKTLFQNASGHKINSIVGFACGSLSRPYNPHTDFQHALLITLKDWLKKKDPGKELSCYIQDVLNTSADKDFLAKFGFEVVDDPAGWSKVDEQSVVLSIAPDVPIKQIIAENARPAIVIWVKEKEEEEEKKDEEKRAERAKVRERQRKEKKEGLNLADILPPTGTDPDTSRTREMMKGYDMHELGDSQHFRDAVIYIRKM